MKSTYPNPDRGILSRRGLSGILLGCLTITISIHLTAQEVDDAQVFELPEYSVYAQAAESAVEAQRESDIIGSFLGSDSLADLPDDDLGEALTRLAGINVVGGAGTDAAVVTIRGAEGQYNSIRINGAAPANAKLGDRSFDLNQIPTEMVRSVQVIKSVTAEYPADSIGGAVDVKTASAFNLIEPVQRYKIESRYREMGDETGWGANYVYANTYDVGDGKNNLGVFLNFNYTDESLVVWNTQNRFLDQDSRIPVSRDPNFESFANQSILSVNPDATIPIWDRYDPDERRVTRDEFTFTGSIDYKLSDKTTLHFRPWVQVYNQNRNLYANRLDRVERAFDRNLWFFLDEAGSPLGQWVDDDEDGFLGSEGDSFINAVDGNGELVMTQSYEANRDGRMRRQVQNVDTESMTYSLDLGGETVLDNGILDYRLYYSVDDSESLTSEWRFQRDFRDTSGGLLPLRLRMIDGTAPTPEFIVFEVTEGRGHVPANNRVNVFGDADKIFTDTILYGYEDVHEDIVLAELNYKHRFGDNFTLKTGARYRSATRENFLNQVFFRPSAGAGEVFPATEMIDINTQTGGNMTLFDGKYKDTFGPYLYAEPFFEFFHSDLNSNPGNWDFNRSDLRDAADTADLEETISAGYVQGTYRWKELTIVAGIRHERTKLDTTWKPSNFSVNTDNLPGLTNQEKSNVNGKITEWLTDNGFPGDADSFSFGDWVDDINAKKDYNNTLPSIVSTWRVGGSGHVFRFAWTNTLTRPNYRQLVPFDLGLANQQMYESGVPPVAGRTDDFRFGNPDLKEQTSENWDFAWEYYFGPEQRNSFSVTFFKKDLEDFLVEATFDREIEVPVDPNDPSQGMTTDTQEAEYWTNGSAASIEGVEVSGYFNFGTIFTNSELLSRLSFVPNYTYVKGDSVLPQFDSDELNNGNIVKIGEEPIAGLIGQAEHIFNLQLFYETRRFNWRLSYNFVDDVLRTPSTAALDSLTKDEAKSKIDLSVRYRLFKDSETFIFLEVDNLTNEPQDNRYVGQTAGLYVENFEETGRRYVMGLRGTF